MRARLFQPEEARALVFGDPAPARIGFFAFYTALRGLGEHPGMERARMWIAALGDTARYATTAEGRARLARLAQLPDSAPAEIVARLDVAHPETWRVGLGTGADSASGMSPWLYAPRTDGQILHYMAAATSPAPDGSLRFTGVPAGTYQLALLAPPGTGPESLAALSIRGDPGQFSVRAGSRRDLGTIRIRP